MRMAEDGGRCDSSGGYAPGKESYGCGGSLPYRLGEGVRGSAEWPGSW